LIHIDLGVFWATAGAQMGTPLLTAPTVDKDSISQTFDTPRVVCHTYGQFASMLSAAVINSESGIPYSRSLILASVIVILMSYIMQKFMNSPDIDEFKGSPGPR